MHIHDFTARRPDWQVLPQWAVEECEERCNVPRASLLFFARTALLTPAPSGTVCHDANLTAFRLLQQLNQLHNLRQPQQRHRYYFNRLMFQAQWPHHRKVVCTLARAHTA
jgi:hypothetical protein